jgi:hypothetical protein
MDGRKGAMAFDEGLADRLREVLNGLAGLTERRMFGGVGFLLHGNMVCGVLGDRLIVRIGSEAYDAVLGEDHVESFDPTGRPMRGWVYVDGDGVAENADLSAWLDRAVEFVLTLPPKGTRS